MLPVVGLSELRVSEVCRPIAAIREGSFWMGFEETPDVEVLDAVLAVQEVQGGSLTSNLVR